MVNPQVIQIQMVQPQAALMEVQELRIEILPEQKRDTLIRGSASGANGSTQKTNSGTLGTGTPTTGTSSGTIGTGTTTSGTKQRYCWDRHQLIRNHYWYNWNRGSTSITNGCSSDFNGSISGTSGSSGKVLLLEIIIQEELSQPFIKGIEDTM